MAIPSSCRRGSNGEECSGVGHCSCGRCHCQQNVRGVSFHDSIIITILYAKLKSDFNDSKVPEYRYYGDVCECNNFDCGLDSDSRICSGEFVSYCMCVHAQFVLTYALSSIYYMLT